MAKYVSLGGYPVLETKVDVNETEKFRKALYDLWSVLAQGTHGAHQGGLCGLYKGALARQLDPASVEKLDAATKAAYAVLTGK